MDVKLYGKLILNYVGANVQAVPPMLKPEFYKFWKFSCSTFIESVFFLKNFRFHSLVFTLECKLWKKNLGIGFPTYQTFRSLFFDS